MIKEKRQKVEFIESYIKWGNSDYQWNDNHGELIRCGECKFRNNDGECTQFNAYTSASGDVFTPHDRFYCGWAERKEE